MYIFFKCRVGGATKEQEHWNRTGWGSRGIFGVPQTRQLGCLLSDLVIRDRRPQCIHRLKNFFGACRGVSAECISSWCPVPLHKSQIPFPPARFRRQDS